MDEDYKYPLCTDCKKEIYEKYEDTGVDMKFYWKLHILKNTFDELMEMDLEDEQFELIVSTLKYYVNK
jgi:hypothetical protein